MPEPHDRHRHGPALTRTIVLLAAAALAAAANAAAGNVVALPSPVAPLSASPPLGGGAASSAESVRHRIAATTTVRVAVDRAGVPFRVVATQRLDVRVLGDYYFTIGAPVVAVLPGPGSQATPGFRVGSIVWAGFDPGQRVLSARATLDAAQAAPSLPLRIRVSGDRTVLVNLTRVSAGSYTAAATAAPLLRYLSSLRRAAEHDQTPLSATAVVTGRPTPVRLSVLAPLSVRGTIGGRKVSLLLGDRAVVRARGAVDLRVTPSTMVAAPRRGLTGRALLDLAARASLTFARTRQYQAFLGNPDPVGRSSTTYLYRTAARPSAVATAAPHTRGGAWTTVAAAAGTLLALAAALAVWARS
jgi:hypothetical protein